VVSPVNFEHCAPKCNTVKALNIQSCDCVCERNWEGEPES